MSKQKQVRVECDFIFNEIYLMPDRYQKLSKSPNEDIKYIHKDTSNDLNIQYDRFRSTREVLKKVRDDEINRITNECHLGWSYEACGTSL